MLSLCRTKFFGRRSSCRIRIRSIARYIERGYSSCRVVVVAREHILLYSREHFLHVDFGGVDIGIERVKELYFDLIWFEFLLHWCCCCFFGFVVANRLWSRVLLTTYDLHNWAVFGVWECVRVLRIRIQVLWQIILNFIYLCAIILSSIRLTRIVYSVSCATRCQMVFEGIIGKMLRWLCWISFFIYFASLASYFYFPSSFR